MIIAYYKLVQLPDEVRKSNNIRSKKRLDCIEYSGSYKGLDSFKNKKNQLYFYLTPCKNFINTDRKRMAEYSLTGSGLNLTSIYLDDIDFPNIGYGYPNSHRTLSNNEPNPLFEFSNDAYLFKINKDYSEIEIYVIKDARNLINMYYQSMLDNLLDDEIELIKKTSKPFFNYGKVI